MVGMGRMRERLATVGVTVLTLKLLGLSVGGLRVCLPTDHRHHGSAASGCSMHHQVDPPGVPHGGHGQAVPTAPVDHAPHAGTHPPADGRDRAMCGCADDPGSVYLGGIGILPRPIVLAPLRGHGAIGVQPQASHGHHRPPPLAPPPRFAFSLLVC